jgi:hypothetical protein
MLAKVYSHICNTLIASIITFGLMDHQKMPLESYFQEARELLAATLVSMLDVPEQWYAPMLQANHPSSFCQLLCHGSFRFHC